MKAEILSQEVHVGAVAVAFDRTGDAATADCGTLR
jgi:hypothetical protein